VVVLGAGLHSSSRRQRMHSQSTREQLLMDMWRVLVRRALGKVVGGCQHEAAGKRGVRCIPALYGPPSTVPSRRRLFPTPPSRFFLCSSPRAWGARFRGDSSRFFPVI
jgi:hypothetical protein